jgi:hypothetical protein
VVAMTNEIKQFPVAADLRLLATKHPGRYEPAKVPNFMRGNNFREYSTYSFDAAPRSAPSLSVKRNGVGKLHTARVRLIGSSIRWRIKTG